MGGVRTAHKKNEFTRGCILKPLLTSGGANGAIGKASSLRARRGEV